MLEKTIYMSKFPSLFTLEIWRTQCSGLTPNMANFQSKLLSLYNTLVQVVCVALPSTVIWDIKVQPKISFFTWKATWGKVYLIYGSKESVEMFLVS